MGDQALKVGVMGSAGEDRAIEDQKLNNLKRSMTMNDSTSETKDPLCGMTVDEATALQAQRDGKTFYFCSDHCRQKFLSTPAGAKPEDKAGSCCG
jgi:YHS domain-containing protein